MFDIDRIGGQRALDTMVEAVVIAGRQALAIQDGVAEQVEHKPDDSPVTRADREVESRLRTLAEQHFPDLGFWGEETGGEETSRSGLCWIVDPIDGTRAFIRGLPTWSVLVALLEEGEPVIGIAYLPATDTLFTGIQGLGSRVNGRPCRLSNEAQLDRSLLCHGGLAQFTDSGLDALLPALGKSTYTQRGVGDFACYAALLQGQADVVVDPGIQPYDVAPAALLIREAGGSFTNLEGAETIHGPGAAASNGKLQPALLQVLRAHPASVSSS